MELDAASAGSVDGITRRSYDGRNLPVTSADLSRAEVTTRDIARGAHPHFLIKEISESPDSVRSTLRGRLVADGDGTLEVRLGAEVMCDDLRAELAAGAIQRVLVIGQGTAAVAGRAVAAAVEAEGKKSAPAAAAPAEESAAAPATSTAPTTRSARSRCSRTVKGVE